MQNTSEKPRPVYLSLTEYGWQITAIASIAHRITGVALFGGIAFLLWLLDLALSSAAGFAEAEELLAAPLPKLVLWGILSLLIYHLVAGIKHLLLDFHIGDTFEAATRSSYVVLIVSAVLVALTGVWLWS